MLKVNFKSYIRNIFLIKDVLRGPKREISVKQGENYIALSVRNMCLLDGAFVASLATVLFIDVTLVIL